MPQAGLEPASRPSAPTRTLPPKDHVVACIEAAFKASRERREVAVGWASVEMFGGVWGRWLTFRFRASIAAELTFRLTSQRRSNSCPTAERSSSSSSTRFDEADADRRR